MSIYANPRANLNWLLDEATRSGPAVASRSKELQSGLAARALPIRTFLVGSLHHKSITPVPMPGSDYAYGSFLAQLNQR